MRTPRVIVVAALSAVLLGSLSGCDADGGPDALACTDEVTAWVTASEGFGQAEPAEQAPRIADAVGSAPDASCVFANADGGEVAVYLTGGEGGAEAIGQELVQGLRAEGYEISTQTAGGEVRTTTLASGTQIATVTVHDPADASWKLPEGTAAVVFALF